MKNLLRLIIIALAGFFILMGLSRPSALQKLYTFWMWLALILGWLISRLLLIVLFFLVITPIGLIMRLMGKSPLEMKYHKSSYWILRERKPANYEKLY